MHRQKIVSFYARGMSTRDIQAQLQDLYGVEVSKELLGMWMTQNESAKFWLQVLTEVDDAHYQLEARPQSLCY